MMKKTEELIRKAGIKACLLYNCTTDRIIYEYNADARLPMASITKLITALTVRECVSDPDNTYYVIEDCADFLQSLNASVAGYVSFPGRSFSVTEYLYGLLLPSGCDAAYTLDKNLGKGDRTAFVEKMNATAERIGCRDTHLTDASGFGREGEHYSTVKDICRMLCLAMQDPLLERILRTIRHVVGEDDLWTMGNTNLLIRCSTNTFFPYCLGGKTGTTPSAGHCFCCMLERGGQQYAFVELGAFCDFSEEQRVCLYRDVITEILCDYFAESGPFMRVSFSDHYLPVPAGTILRPEVQTLFNNTQQTPQIRFTSDNPETASVDEQGNITVCGEGVAEIRLVTQTGDYDMLYINSTGSEYVELRR